MQDEHIEAFDEQLEAAFGAAYDPVPFLGDVAIGSLGFKVEGGDMFIFNNAERLLGDNSRFRYLHETRTVSQRSRPFSCTYNATVTTGATGGATIPSNIPVNATVNLEYSFQSGNSFIFASPNCITSELNFPAQYCDFIASSPELYDEAHKAFDHPKSSMLHRDKLYVAVKAVYAKDGAFVAQTRNERYREARLTLALQRISDLGFRLEVTDRREVTSDVTIMNDGFTIGVVWYEVNLPKTKKGEAHKTKPWILQKLKSRKSRKAE